MTNTKKRFYFFYAHLGISFLILLVLMYLIFYKWYPHDLFYTSGGWHGTKIVFFVDMVLGPLLTLIVTNSNKKNNELIRDLCFCALVQIAALSYGINLLVNTKPTVLSIHGGVIHAIQQNQIEKVQDKTAFEGHSNTPPLIYSDDISRYDLSLPELNAKANAILKYARDYGAPIHAIPITFDSIKNRTEELETLTRKSLNSIKQNPNYNSQQLDLLRNKNWFVLEIDGSFQNGYIAFDQEGKIHKSICCH